MEWDQLQRAVTGKQRERQHFLSKEGVGRLITPTLCAEQQALGKEHPRNLGAMLCFLFLVFQPRQVLFLIRAQSGENAIEALVLGIKI